jgi:hypothetical protein
VLVHHAGAAAAEEDPQEGQGKAPAKEPARLVPAIRSIRTVIGWTISNLACEMFGWRHPDRYLRIRYEDLVQSPLEAITQVLAKVSLDPPSTLERNDLADNRHQLYGNAMRFKPLGVSDLKEDVAWKTDMPAGYRRLVGGLAWPLCLRYGYSSPRQRAAAAAKVEASREPQ